ncbi:MAG: FHA domain-containing protein [Dehalococcoidia bacterium]
MASLTWSIEDGLHVADLGEGEAVIGRAPESAVCVAHGTVSRQHARITFSAGVYRAEHMSHTNPTRLEGRAIEAPAVLADGNRLEMGTVVLTFHRLDQVALHGRVSCPHCRRFNATDRPDCWFCGENLVNATMSSTPRARASCALVQSDGTRIVLFAGDEHCFPAPAGLGRECDGSVRAEDEGVFVVAGAEGIVSRNGAEVSASAPLAHGDRLLVAGSALLVLMP